MVKRIIGLITREISGLHEAAYLLAIFAFSSQFLGLIRDRILAGRFGTSEILDVYYASFRIPDLIFVGVSALVSASVLVPIFSSNLENKAVLKKYVDSIFTVFAGLMIVIVVIAMIFTPQLLQLVAPGLMDSAMLPELILYTRILLLSPLLLGVSQLFGGIVQSYKKFVLYAISPILYNFGIIIGVIVLYPIFGTIGLIWGVCLGLIFHLCVQLPTVARHGLLPRIHTGLDWDIIKKVFLLSFPRTITLASAQLTLIVLLAIASQISEGAITIFNFAYNLQAVPLSVIGVSYSLAAFPTLSKLFSEGNIEKFIAQLVNSARHIIFWSLPVVALFIVLRAQIVRTVLGAGAFNWNDTRLTAAALALFIVSVLAQSLILLFVRGYYSAGKTAKPLIINIFSSLVTVGLAFWLVHIYQRTPEMQYFFEGLLRVEGGLHTALLMLPLAFSIGTILNLVLLWITFEVSFSGFSRNLARPFFQSLLASVGTGVATYLSLQLFNQVLDTQTLLGIFAQGLFAGLVGIAAGVAIFVLIKNREFKEVAVAMHHKIWKTPVVTTGQEEL